MYMLITFQTGREVGKRAKVRKEVRPEALEGDQRAAAEA